MILPRRIILLALSIKLFGGFAGTESHINQRAIATNPTILSGEIGIPDTIDNNI